MLVAGRLVCVKIVFFSWRVHAGTAGTLLKMLSVWCGVRGGGSSLTFRCPGLAGPNPFAGLRIG